MPTGAINPTSTTAFGRTTGRVAMLIALSAGLGGCASSGADLLGTLTPQERVTQATDPSSSKSELAKATDYWGKAHAEKPSDPRAALNYARNLKALGNKQQALIVMQEAHRHNPMDRSINGEYGRLALEHDQISAAQKLLEAADDPSAPDWRVLSARGTVLAKQGKHTEAIPFYERALQVSPDNPSVLNNLAMAMALDGKADKAEAMLRKATAANPSDERVSQNLALVLGLQGKHNEAEGVTPKGASHDAVAHNRSVVKQMVGDTPQSAPAAASSWDAQTAGPIPAKARTTASIQGPAKVTGAGMDPTELVRRLADTDQHMIRGRLLMKGGN
jgi:Flp pilus assembly protein TadD